MKLKTTEGGAIGKKASRALGAFALAALFFFAAGCTPNDPYRDSERGRNIFYTTFLEPPKHLDPARAYSSDEYDFLAQVYEPPLQYHYLKRPYTLMPLTVEEVPQPVYYGRDGKKLPESAPAKEVDRAVYELRVKKGVMYQDHPAFARDKNGSPLYSAVNPREAKNIQTLDDLPVKGTRELTADDFIYEIMRLADPQVESPVLSILEKYILGLKEYSEALRADLDDIRAERRKAAGFSYNQTEDEKSNPITLDYRKHPFPGVEKVDSHTFRVILKTKYPQFVYWLAMPFFAPVPKEAADFYNQGALAERNITLDRYPVGTGPYMMETFNPNMEIALAKNRNYHYEAYPDEGEDGDAQRGLFKYAGQRLPFIEKMVFKLEKEAIPRWNKFLQGYYDNSGITSDSFDQAVSMTTAGRPELTDEMKERGMSLLTSVRSSSYYSGFNMLDDVVGGYSPEKQKLRQAISIALDYEEFIEIFQNGRGLSAMSPLPPGIFGYKEGAGGINPLVYDWDAVRNRPARKSIEEAKKLLAEAGYPGGRDKAGRPLVITFDNPWTGADSAPMINWYIKKFALLGIQLENRTTDYNRFQEKMFKGNFQFFSWGWNADYPDPENFFFLLAGSNSKVKYQGENAANYSNPEFDRLFKTMENMENGPERQAVIDEMTTIVRSDAPWIFGYHPVAFTLFHGWVENVKPNAMANNTMKYIKIDAEKRQYLRDEWNEPRLWPVVAVIALLVIGSLPAIITMRRKRGLSKRR
ncbi:MAG TPA: peptide ABC transporter substrate-binding protein [Deltaproteobacteria bacterium]|nr:peptide ABC transporter substrate-binding protein [Deltaproteobacteria bacterium]